LTNSVKSPKRSSSSWGLPPWLRAWLFGRRQRNRRGPGIDTPLILAIGRRGDRPLISALGCPP
jgi:hypothetical protein